MSQTGNSGYAARMLEDVRAALTAKDYARATQLAKNALDAGIVHPVLLTLRANALQSEGRLGEALADLRRAVIMAPKDIVALNGLGLCLQAMDKFPEALQAFNSALAIRAAFPPALFNRGYTYELMGQLDAARKDYETALKLEPRFPEPAARLASLATRRRDWAEVRARAGQALAADASLTPALLALATADMEDGNLAAAKERISGVLALPHLSASDRGIALGMMGDVLDREDRAHDAFAAYAQGNEILREFYAPRYAGPNMQTAPRFVQTLAEYFGKSADWTPAPPDESSPAAGHVFVLGFPRSGTTLLEQALASHPATIAASEKEFLIDSFHEFMGSPETLDRLAAIDETAARRFRELYWQRLRQAGIDPAGKTFIDKQPLNTVKLPLIAKLFPNAKVLFAIRDPRDTVLSCFRRRFQMNIDMFEFLTLDGTANYYAAVMRLGELARAKLPLSLMESRHEDLIADFDTHMRAICDFIAIPWDEKMRDFANRAPSVATPSAPQLMLGLNTEGAGQWRRYAAELAPVMPVLAPWVEKFGYAKDQLSG
jgi:tetratricopeptide (TPR) repeat protein